MQQKHPSGFTLIELSIALVIIGLIVGGVLVGKDLIEAAELRQAASDVDRLTSCINTFKLKYNCLPGDCARATQFFTGVSNGNGNSSYAEWNEGNINVWVHLQSAGIPFYGPYSTSAITGPDPGVNSPLIPWMYKNTYLQPLVRVDGVAMYLKSGNFCGNPAWNGCEDSQPKIIRNWLNTNHIVLGTYGINTSTSRLYTVETYGIRSSFLKSLDGKIDDGLPMTGNMRSFDHSGTSCTIGFGSSTSLTQPYLTGSTNACTAYINLGF